MTTTSLVARIRRFNKGREPERLALKYQAMRLNPFRFFRGTAHLFYEDWPAGSRLDKSPHAWVCGDLHLENFGTFKGENGLAYFDINDFDEACLAPASRDLARLATSALLAANGIIKVSTADACICWQNAQSVYVDQLSTGKAMWVERSTAQGMVKRLLQGLKDRSQSAFLKSRTQVISGRRRIRVDHQRTLAASKIERHAVIDLIGATTMAKNDPSYYRVLDVVRRIAGTGSLGVRRYAILVHGQGGASGQVFLDLKEAVPSAMAPYLAVRQPTWASEADRVVTIQCRVQAVSPALIAAIRVGRQSYVLRELQPIEDRLSLDRARHTHSRFAEGLATMTQVVAWGQLRSGGRQGSATADEWIEFSQDRSWARPLEDYARGYANVVARDWKEFSEAYDDGEFGEK
jgi:uncharacterized protein (DUF2252 family)